MTAGFGGFSSVTKGDKFCGAQTKTSTVEIYCYCRQLPNEMITSNENN